MGKYLCCLCGAAFQGDDARLHEWTEHIPDKAKQDASGREIHNRLGDVDAEYVGSHWQVIYDTRGTNWTHPKEIEGKKRRIERILHDHEYTLTLRELHEKMLLDSEKAPNKESWILRDEVRDLLQEMVAEDRIIQNGKTWGHPEAEALPA